MKNKLSYFITRSSMFGIGFFLLFKYAGKDAWISVILGSLISIGIIYVYHFIKDYLKDSTLKEKLQQTFLGKIFLFIFIIFYLYLMTIVLILLPMFVNSFYLLYTPKILVVIPFLLLAIYIANKDKSTLISLSNLLYACSLVIIFLYAFLLIKYIDFNNILPIYTNKNINILKATLIYASISAIPNIITINYEDNTFKDDLKNYICGTLTSFSITLVTILTLGEPLIKIYSFPEYDVLKQIKILDFIENIENLSTFVWYFDMFFMLGTLTTNLKETLPKKYNKVYYYLSILIVLILATFIIGENYRIISIMFKAYAIVLYIFFFIFVLLLIYLKAKKKKSQTS